MMKPERERLALLEMETLRKRDRGAAQRTERGDRVRRAAELAGRSVQHIYKILSGAGQGTEQDRQAIAEAGVLDVPARDWSRTRRRGPAMSERSAAPDGSPDRQQLLLLARILAARERSRRFALKLYAKLIGGHE